MLKWIICCVCIVVIMMIFITCSLAFWLCLLIITWMNISMRMMMIEILLLEFYWNFYTLFWNLCFKYLVLSFREGFKLFSFMIRYILSLIYWLKFMWWSWLSIYIELRIIILIEINLLLRNISLQLQSFVYYEIFILAFWLNLMLLIIVSYIMIVSLSNIYTLIWSNYPAWNLRNKRRFVLICLRGWRDQIAQVCWFISKVLSA